MPTYYFSGVNRPDMVKLLAEQQAAGMLNARSACEPRLVESYSRYPQVKLALDCDARQRHRFQRTGRASSVAYELDAAIDRYASVICRIGWRLEWCSSFDVIGDPKLSSWCYERLLERLAHPALCSRVRWIYQHGSLSELEERASSLKVVGIGGMVPILERAGVAKFLQVLAPISKVLERCGALGHIYGLSDAYALSQLASLPWFASADGSTWLIAYRAGELLQTSGEHINATQLHLRLSKRAIAENNIRVTLEWLDPDRPHQFAWFTRTPFSS